MAEFERLRAIVDALPRCSDHMEQAILDEVLPSDSMALASIAISLKRIADALWGVEGTTGIVQLLNGVEMNGRQR